MKRLLSMLLAVTMVLTMVVTTATVSADETQFTDINHWAKEYILYVTSEENGKLMSGTSATTFNPNGDVTKEQFNDLSKVKCWPVRYVYNGKGHWVVVEKGKIVFNSLINSQCVAKGKPDTKDNTRVIKLAR